MSDPATFEPRDLHRRIVELERRDERTRQLGTEIARLLKRRHRRCAGPCAVGDALRAWTEYTGEELP